MGLIGLLRISSRVILLILGSEILMRLKGSISGSVTSCTLLPMISRILEALDLSCGRFKLTFPLIPIKIRYIFPLILTGHVVHSSRNYFHSPIPKV